MRATDSRRHWRQRPYSGAAIPIGDAMTEATCRIDVRIPLLQVAPAAASDRAAMPSRCGCPGANAAARVGMPSRTSVMIVVSLTVMVRLKRDPAELTGADPTEPMGRDPAEVTAAACRSRIQHAAHTSTPKATTLTTTKLRTTLPVTA